MHDFLKHYSEVKNASPEDRPIDVDKLGNIKISTISLANHSEDLNLKIVTK